MRPTTVIYKILKKAIRVTPFKKSLFSVIKLFGVPPKKIRRELKFNGAFKVPVGKSSFQLMNYDYDKFSLENDVFWFGLKGWEPESINLWVKLSRESKTILDIGANTGIYSLISAAVAPSAVIYSFEPVDRIYDKFQKNISINKFSSIHPEKIALSDKNGFTILYDFVGDIPLNATLNSSWHSDSKARVEKKIETKRLDNFIEENHILNIDLMKIDVELHEPQVLRGMGKYLEKFKPAILIEIFNEEMWNQLQEIIKDLNYQVFYIDDLKGARRINGFEIFEGYNFLFCSEETAKRIFATK